MILMFILEKQNDAGAELLMVQSLQEARPVSKPASIVIHPTMTTAETTKVEPKKKPRAPRKKKDPNAPSAPCSAYTLFFRNTQATIKAQNPVF